jgi:hypothetical protein
MRGDQLTFNDLNEPAFYLNVALDLKELVIKADMVTATTVPVPWNVVVHGRMGIVREPRLSFRGECYVRKVVNHMCEVKIQITTEHEKLPDAVQASQDKSVHQEYMADPCGEAGHHNSRLIYDQTKASKYGGGLHSFSATVWFALKKKPLSTTSTSTSTSSASSALASDSSAQMPKPAEP